MRGLGRLLLVALVLPGLVAWRWPGEINRLCRTARQAFADGNAAEAARLYGEVVAAGEESPAVFYNLGTAQYGQRDYAGAIESLGRGLEQAEDDPSMTNRLRYNLGNAYYRLDMIEEAAKQYEAALRADPSDADARYNLELCREKLKPPENQPNQPNQANQDPNRNQDPQGNSNQQGQPPKQDQPNQQGEQPEQPQQPQQGRPDENQTLGGLTEAEVDRLLRELEKDERQLRPYFRPRQSESEDPFADIERRMRELSGESTERDW